MPFRLMTKGETASAAGVAFVLEQSQVSSHLLDEATVLSIVGNSFHPTLINAAVGSKEANLQWMNGEVATSLALRHPQDIQA